MLSRFYPKSFLRLILTGFGLVALPLLVALGNAALNVQRLAEQSERAVREAALAARTSREMGEALAGMERALRQPRPSGAGAEDYLRLSEEFARAAREYAALPLDAGSRRGLQAVLEEERRLRSALQAGGAGEGFAAFASHARAVLAASGRVIDAEVESLRTTALAARNTLTWQLLAALPLTLAIALWFRAIVSGQLRQFDRAIRAIGRAEASDGVTVSGPQDLAALGRRLEWLRRRLAELEEQKNRFLRHVSHDLKTPLTSIREGVQLLGEGVPGPLTEQQRTIIEIIDQNSRRLQQMIEELIDYQQAGFAAGSIDPQPVAFDVVVTQVLRTHRLVAAARGIRFERRLAPLLVEGDGDKLRVVVDNLVTNAIKFSPREGVVHLALAQEGTNAVLDVVDEGAGVPAEERERIFEPFFRGTRARRGTVKGSGLGLAIAREYVLAHRGTIEVVADARGGHFRVTLPLKWEKTA